MAATALKKPSKKRTTNTTTNVHKKQKTGREVISDSLHLPQREVFGIGPSALKPVASLSEIGSSRHPALSRPIYLSLICKIAKLNALKLGASDVWLFMHHLHGTSRESPAPSHNELKNQPQSYCKLNPKNVPFLACWFCLN